MKADPDDIDVIEVAALVEDYAKAFPKPYAVQWDELGETRQENFDTEAEACAFKRGMLLAPRPWVYVDCIAPVSMKAA